LFWPSPFSSERRTFGVSVGRVIIPPPFSGKGKEDAFSSGWRTTCTVLEGGEKLSPPLLEEEEIVNP